MNGPQRFPVVNRQALGNTSLFKRQVKERRLILGQPPGPTISDAELIYKEKLAHYEGVQKNHENLVGLIGKADADKALAEAKASYEEALAEWNASQPRG